MAAINPCSFAIWNTLLAFWNRSFAMQKTNLTQPESDFGEQKTAGVWEKDTANPSNSMLEYCNESQ